MAATVTPLPLRPADALVPLTVYSKPSCVQCDATYRALRRYSLIEGVHYEVVDLTRDGDALERVKALGFQQAPVITHGEQAWSGYRPDLLKIAAAELLPKPAA